MCVGLFKTELRFNIIAYCFLLLLLSGVFRADIPCSFRGEPDMYQKLHDDVERTVKFCIETEEKIPLNEVTNFEEVCKVYSYFIT